MGKSKAKKWMLLYTEIYKLGEGGNADVYLVEDNKPESRYALKELRSNNRSEEKNSDFDTYNSLTPNWYYKVLR